MWYWVGIAFIAFLVIFEVFRTEQKPVFQSEEIKISSAIALRNAAQVYSYDPEVVTSGEKTAAALSNYLPANIKIPDDHKISIKCVTTADQTEEMQCNAQGGIMYMVTYVPMNFESTTDRQKFLKDLYDKTEGLKGTGLWKSNGEIETFSGVRAKVPEIFNSLRLRLSADVFVILDRKATASCLAPKVPNLWTAGCKCPDGQKFDGGTCVSCGSQISQCIEKMPDLCTDGFPVGERLLTDSSMVIGQSFAPELFTGLISDGFFDGGTYMIKEMLVPEKPGYYISRSKRINNTTWINAMCITTKSGLCCIQENYYTGTGNFAVEYYCPAYGQAREILEPNVIPQNRMSAIASAIAELRSRFASFTCN